jgi:O-antigen ligase
MARDDRVLRLPAAPRFEPSTHTAGVIIALAIGAAVVLIAVVPMPFLAAGTVVAVATAIAYRLPTAAVVGALAADALPRLFQTVPGFNQYFGTLYGGVRIVDVALVALFLAACVRIIFHHRRARCSFVTFAVLFAVWLALEVIVGFAQRGLPAFGEFRLRYLLLALPFFVAVSFPTPRARRRLFVTALLLMVGLPLAAVPVIAMRRGLVFGWQHPFLIGPLSLALMLGCVALELARRAGYLRLPAWVSGAVAAVSLLLIITDGQRSVWLAAMAILAVLVLIGRVSLQRVWIAVTVILLVTVVAALSLSGAFGTPLRYLEERATAFSSPLQDPNAAWRYYVWEAELAVVRKHPITGNSFGDYAAVYVPQINRLIDTQPHDLYVQHLVKLGGIGLALYLLAVASLAIALVRRSRQALDAGDPEAVLLVIAFATLIGAHAYYVAYGFEYFSWVLVGIGAAYLLTTAPRDTPSPG